MKRSSLARQGSAVVLFFVTSVTGLGSGLSFDEQEQFLKVARITRSRTLSEGITQAKRVTMSDGQRTHEAQVQDIDEFKQVMTTALGTEFNFKDTYKANIAAYRLNRLLRIDMVPPSVERKVGGKTAAVTWWVDDVLMTEKQRFLSKKNPPDPDRWNRQMYIVRVFDQLIYNMDRNLGNLIITKDWNLWMIDHTRAFRLHENLKSREDLSRCDRQLLEAMKGLSLSSLQRELKPYLTDGEIKALLARRDRIVSFFEREIQEKGEPAVLYDFLALR